MVRGCAGQVMEGGVFLLRRFVVALMRQAAAGESLVPHVKERFWFAFLGYSWGSNVRSCKRSTPALLWQWPDTGLQDVEVLVEYRLPLASKRADVVPWTSVDDRRSPGFESLQPKARPCE